MARAQIKLLALLGEYAKYEDSNQVTRDSSFPDDPTPDDVARITKRMYEQHDARRALGMRTRTIVQKSFSGDRYLREHEQMLWIGKAKNDMAFPGTSPRASPSPMSISKPLRVSTTPNHVALPKVRVNRESADDSLPSLAFGNTSAMPSIITDILPSTVADVAIGERIWMNKSQPVVISIAENGLRRESRTVGIVDGDTELV